MKRRFIKATILALFSLTLISCNEDQFFEKEDLQTQKDFYKENVLESFKNEIDQNNNTQDDHPNGSYNKYENPSSIKIDNHDEYYNDDNYHENNDNKNQSESDSIDSDYVYEEEIEIETEEINHNDNDDEGFVNNQEDESTITTENNIEKIHFSNLKNKIDILWVIDNSGSMQDEQESLARNFDIFINEFIKNNIDFRMGITTTDTKRNNNSNTNQNSLNLLTSIKLQEDENKFIENFQRAIQVGTNGSAREKGLKAAEIFTNVHNPKYFRKDAYFVIIFVTDEEDQSEKSVEDHINQIQKWNTVPSMLKIHSIVNTKNNRMKTKYFTPGFKRYEKATQITGGSIINIDEDFYNSLEIIGSKTANLGQSYSLKKIPINSNIQVFVNGNEVHSGWTYHPDTRTIQFESIYNYDEDSEILVKYESKVK